MTIEAQGRRIRVSGSVTGDALECCVGAGEWKTRAGVIKGRR